MRAAPGPHPPDSEPGEGGEANFDGLVGPTHNYAGLAHGNVASQANRKRPANPKAAALQGLDKMRRNADRGLLQGVIPPLERPDLEWLRSLGYSGGDAAVLDKAAKEHPVLLAACYSASSMWTANAATVSPSADSEDGKLHITPANLTSQVHRALEPAQTAAILRRLFPGEDFVHHPPLPAGRHFADEGAANHTRLAPDHGLPGIQVFAYGFESLAAPEASAKVTRKFLPRQSREASEAVARLHRLRPGRAVFLRQSPAAVDAGVFHNDVIAVGNGPVLFCHEQAFADRAAALRLVKSRYAALGKGPLHVVEVKASEVSLKDAVATYLFNSQILTLPGSGGMVILAARECRENRAVRRCLEKLVARDPHLRAVEYADLRQSMRNGGGPACLRLRAPMTALEWSRVPQGVKIDAGLYARLSAWVEKHYRDRLLPKDLADPALLRESRAALDDLTGILGLGSLYPFQR